jgi:murein DD-endopeptidase MepM/ murein hydrolase activator NlpD
VASCEHARDEPVPVVLTRATRVALFIAAVGAVATGCAGADSATATIADASLAAPTTTASPSSTASPTTTTTPTTPTTATTTTTDVSTSTVAAVASTPYVIPLADVGAAGWGTTHAGYTATDIFIGCGATVVAPVDGVVLQVRRVDGWDAAVDNPATRGGRSVAILGDDGVRYYMAHFDAIEPTVVEGERVDAGVAIGTVGQTGRSSACHVHFALSPPCPGPEWSVRRGVIWPYPYLDAWRAGEQRSPADEVNRWVSEHPEGCADAMADPYAADAALP